jgi:hypothetical protein
MKGGKFILVLDSFGKAGLTIFLKNLKTSRRGISRSHEGNPKAD